MALKLFYVLFTLIFCCISLTTKINSRDFQEQAPKHNKCGEIKYNFPALHGKEGGLSKISLHALKQYIHHVQQARKDIKDKQWIQSVQQFSLFVNEDPILKFDWYYGISLCQKTLKGKTGDDVFQMIDTVCKTPPLFTNQSLVGFPINSIFSEFMQTQNGRRFFSHKDVNLALKKILTDYSNMLQSPQSKKYLNDIEPNGWFCGSADKKINNDWYKCGKNASCYKNWNQWFLRQFKEGLRPIDEGMPERIDREDVIVNACQSTPLSFPKQPILDIQYSDEFWLKDDKYSLIDMFGGSKYKKEYLAHYFVGGTIYQASMDALSYHRWHAPVDGFIEEIYNIDGTYYIDQSQFTHYDSPSYSQSYLSAVAARQVFVIRAKNQKIGKIAIIFIGMAEVSSCIATVQVGQEVKKGDQLGHFMFGGSSHLIVFQKKAKLKFTDQLYKDKGEKGKIQNQKLHSYLAHII